MATQTRNNYTLAGSRAWHQHAQSNNPMYRQMHFTSREHDFINQPFDTADEEGGFTGTHVEFIEAEGSICRWSEISSDEEENAEMAAVQGPATQKGEQPKLTRKGKFKKMALKLYPRKMVGGAKVMGGAIRHPMVTGRKV